MLFAAPSGRPPSEPITIIRGGSAAIPGPASNFTGAVQVDTSFKGSGDARLSGARVTFQPGARSNWHRHPLGQLLIVTKGTGWVQDDGGAVREIRPGDVVWTAPNVKHWHGATPTTSLTHFAVSEALDGKNVTWLEPVADSTYRFGVD
jgi:4-carboxymuconolactone decarboxylase